MSTMQKPKIQSSKFEAEFAQLNRAVSARSERKARAAASYAEREIKYAAAYASLPTGMDLNEEI